jgi:hypothetical protein
MSKKRVMFHTQGHSDPCLDFAQECTKDNAWLGKGYYFWKEEQDAIFWGITAKKNYKKYTVYTATIDCEDVLDTVFNEEHYDFWLRQIDKAINILAKKSGQKLTIEDINSYFIQRGGWGDKVRGIMFQDLPSNETISKVIGFFYRKRIQLAAFDKKIITNFAHHFDGDC